jgi:hypothetical protein
MAEEINDIFRDLLDKAKRQSGIALISFENIEAAVDHNTSSKKQCCQKIQFIHFYRNIVNELSN